MINKIGERHKKRIQNGGSELITFETKRIQNKGKSDLTGRFYKKENLQSFQFAHALPKWTYPAYRNDVNNIVFVDSIEQHHRVDSQISGRKYEIEQLVKRGELIPRLKSQWDFYLNQKK